PPLAELKAMGDINLQLDLQGEAAQAGKTDGEPAQDAAAAPEAAASAEAAAEVSAEPIAESDAALAGGEPPSDEALLEGTAPEERAASIADDEEDGEEGDELSAEGGDSHE